MPRIGVWNTAFLGDAFLSLPLIQILHAGFPDAEIDFYVRKGLEPLFAAQPEISRVFPYDKRRDSSALSSFLALRREMAARHYDIWVSAHLSPRSSVMASLSGAATRVGYEEAAFSRFVYNARVKRDFPNGAEIDRVARLAEALGLGHLAQQDASLRWPQLTLPLAAEAEADRLLAALPPGPLLGIHPGSQWPTKRWPPESFAHVLRRGLDAGANVLLFAGGSESEDAAKVRGLAGLKPGDSAGGRFLDLSAKLSLPVLAALIGRLQCYVTNDSGPMHLAWAQEVPLAVMFGPTVESFGFYPWGSNSRVFQVDEACRPCGKHGHKSCPQKHFRCMLRIDPEEVWQFAQGMLFPWKAEASRRQARLSEIGGTDWAD